MPGRYRTALRWRCKAGAPCDPACLPERVPQKPRHRVLGQGRVAVDARSPAPATGSSSPVSGAGATSSPRGFGAPRDDALPPLKGSLHHNRRLAQWLSLREPGVVHVFTGKAELGQGILTALQLLAAEELDLPLSAVRVHSASTARGPDEGVTSGSLSVQDSGGALQQACAALRALALRQAAQLSPDPRYLGYGRFGSAEGRVIGDYWSLVPEAALDIECPIDVRPKARADRRLLGQARPTRIDLADKLFGAARFIHDLRLPGMLHGRVLRPPVLGARLAGPAGEALGPLPDHVQLVVDGQWIGLVAALEADVDAAAARCMARLRWLSAHDLPSAGDWPRYLQAAPCHTTVVAERGELADMRPQRLATVHLDQDSDKGGSPNRAGARSHTLTAEYFKPYLAHASIGPSCAVALWDGQRLEVWTHSQGIHNLRDDIALALRRGPLPVAKTDITVHHVEGAGCYGHNGADDVAFDAVLLALRFTGRPVRVQWSRADELSHSPFGAAHLVRLSARLDDSGRLSHWQHEIWANGYSSRPGRASTPALLAASEQADASALPLPINPPLAAGGGAERNAVPAYQVPHLRVVSDRLTVMPLRTSAMRALGAFANVFAIESFIDELAQAAGIDPLAFRRRHLEDPRSLAVLDAVVQRSLWWGQTAPAAAGGCASGEASGQGLAWARYKNTGAWCAVLARVRVGREVRVMNLDLAVDVGMVVDLDGVINQIEGGAVQAVSWTLKEQVRFDDTGITSRDWTQYPVLRFSEVPEVVVHVLDRPDEAPLGAGEAAQGPVAAAIGNAVCDALGLRLRSLPLDAEQILRAIHAADPPT